MIKATIEESIMSTRYTIVNDRFSPTPDIVTAAEFRAYCADMNEMNGWEIDLDSISVRDDGIYVGGELIATVNPTTATIEQIADGFFSIDIQDSNAARAAATSDMLAELRALADGHAQLPADQLATYGDTWLEAPLTIVDADGQPMTNAQVAAAVAEKLAALTA